MAIYHLSVKTISRSVGRSATAAAAYRAAVEILDERTGLVHDYTRKQGVESAELVLPDDAPAWAADRAALWNAAEQAETRKNSTVAREVEIALPMELAPAERQRLAHDFASELVERHGCAADVAVHAPGKGGDRRNHHAHILLTTRRLWPEGFREKTRELDDQKTGRPLITEWRARFAVLQNERLQDAGLEAHLDHRSLEAQGLDREPTRHLGPTATAIERRTGQPSRVRLNVEAEATERHVRAKEADKLARQAQAADQAILDLSRTLADATRQRLEQMRAAELREEITRLSPPPVEEVVAADPAVRAAQAVRDPLLKAFEQAQAVERRAQQEAAAWRRTHPLRAKAHDTGLLRANYLSVREQIVRTAQQEWLTLAPTLDDVAQQVRDVEATTRASVLAEQAPVRHALTGLETQYQRKLREEQDARARALVAREFRGLAASRAMRAQGWDETGRQWTATPPPLRTLIDDYNRRPKQQQELILNRVLHDPPHAKTLETLLAQRRDLVRTHHRGLSR